MKKKNNYPKGQGIRNFTTYELESVRFIMRLFSEREGLGDGDTLVNYIHAKLCEHGLEDLNLRESGKYVVNRYVINDFLGAAESRPNKVVVIDVLKKFIELEPTLQGYEHWFTRPDTLIACGDSILKIVSRNRYHSRNDYSFGSFEFQVGQFCKDIAASSLSAEKRLALSYAVYDVLGSEFISHSSAEDIEKWNDVLVKALPMKYPRLCGQKIPNECLI